MRVEHVSLPGQHALFPTVSVDMGRAATQMEKTQYITAVLFLSLWDSEYDQRELLNSIKECGTFERERTLQILTPAFQKDSRQSALLSLLF